MITTTVLIDNTAAPNNELLKAEHGLSLYVETGEEKILIDMGASDQFAANAKRMGIEVSSVDFAFVSHGHSDHTGGLRWFLKNSRAKVYLSDAVFKSRFYSLRHSPKHDISADLRLPEEYSDRFSFIHSSQWINDKIAIVKNDTKRYPVPLANRFLTSQDEKGEHCDTFEHELALTVLTNSGLIIFSSCSHGGALNIMDSCRRFTKKTTICAFVGGLHFVDGKDTGDEIHLFLENLKSMSPQTIIYTGHCTGDLAKQQLSASPHTKFFHTGSSIIL